MHAAIKRKDVFAVKVLRFLKSFLDSAAKDKRAELTDEEAVAVIRRRVKQSAEAKEEYEKGGRGDLAEAEQKEVELLTSYLPAQMKPEELEELVKSAVAGTKASTPADFGRVMGIVMKRVAGRADGQTVKAAVERALKKAAV